ncbi:MAG: WD40 repeat domain-containing protein, partial [Bryobacteraceae bacterium]
MNGRSFRRLITVVALAANLGASLFAASSTTWETGSYAEFLKGKLQGLALTSDGALLPGASIRKSTTVEQPVLWTVVPGPDGSLYAATGHRGKVYKIDPKGVSTVVFSAEQPEVFALCFDAHGILYAATSPKGGVYRIENGKAAEVFHPDAKYIWALLPAPQGGLYVATGDQGRIYRIDNAAKANATGKPAPYFETGQQNVTSLALGPNGHLYAGSEPNGLLFDIASKDQGTILYKSTLPEIHGLAVGTDGTVYASALGGGLSTRVATQTASANATNMAVMASTPTVVSVTDASDNSAGGAPAQIGGLKNADPTKGTATSTITPVPAAQGAQVVDVSGVEKSAIYRISPDKTVETLRSSKDDNVYDLLLDGANILFSTDGQGRIYSLAPDRKTTLFAELGDAEAVRLVKRGSD